MPIELFLVVNNLYWRTNDGKLLLQTNEVEVII